MYSKSQAVKPNDDFGYPICPATIGPGSSQGTSSGNGKQTDLDEECLSNDTLTVESHDNRHRSSVSSSDWSDWSLLNNPETSVHNFHLPSSSNNTFHDHYSQTVAFNNTSMHDETFAFDFQDKSHHQVGTTTKLEMQEAKKDEENLTPSNSLWYVPTSHSLGMVSAQPTSLPSDLNSVNQIDGLNNITLMNGHGSYEASPHTERTKNVQEIDNSEQTDLNFKTSLMSVWNNVKNGFTVQMKTNFKYDCALWLLGNVYHCTKEDKERQKEEHENGRNYITAMDLFKSDFASKIWFTYRKDFTTLPFSQLTTDMGWGCMLRTGQMMLAHALVLHLLGRDWRHLIHKDREDILHHRVLQFFNDKDSKDSPFSLHNLVSIGKRYDKMPGDWYGPSSAAYVIRDAMKETENQHPLLSNICLYVAQDCTVYMEDVLDLCTQPSSHSSLFEDNPSATSADSSGTTASTPTNPNIAHWKSVIILIPVRLGGVDMNKVYSPCIKNMIAHRMCLGVIGGKPKHSLYFIGWQEDKLVYLDPHCCQDYVDCDDPNFSTTSFHCNSPRKMSITKMDPSCTIGFYCKTRKEFNTFIKEAKQMTAPTLQAAPYPMFVFQEGRSEDSVNKDCNPPKTDRILKVRHYDSEGKKRPPKNSDDFVFL